MIKEKNRVCCLGEECLGSEEKEGKSRFLFFQIFRVMPRYVMKTRVLKKLDMPWHDENVPRHESCFLPLISFPHSSLSQLGLNDPKT